MASRKVCDAILDLTSKSPSEVTVLYLGTPSYDSNEMKVLQTSRLLEAGCTILEIQCANECLDSKSHEGKFMQADVVLISGGNALYAMDVWKALGMDRMLVRAARRGVVCAGEFIKLMQIVDDEYTHKFVHSDINTLACIDIYKYT